MRERGVAGTKVVDSVNDRPARVCSPADCAALCLCLPRPVNAPRINLARPVFSHGAPGDMRPQLVRKTLLF